MSGFSYSQDLKHSGSGLTLKDKNWFVSMQLYTPSVRLRTQEFRGVENGQYTSGDRDVYNIYFGLGLGVGYKGWSLNYYHHILYLEADNWDETYGGSRNFYGTPYFQEFNPRIFVPQIIGFANFGYQFKLKKSPVNRDKLVPVLGVFCGIDNVEIATGIEGESWNFLLGFLCHTQHQDLDHLYDTKLYRRFYHLDLIYASPSYRLRLTFSLKAQRRF